MPLPQRVSEREMSKRMRRIAKLTTVRGMKTGEAMRLVGYADSSSRFPALVEDHPEYLRHKGRILQALERKDAKIYDKVATTISKGLKAKKVLNSQIINGKQVDTKVADIPERRKTAELIAKLAGEVGDKDQGNNGAGAVNFNLMLQLVQKAERERGL